MTILPVSSPQAGQSHQRKIHYIDHELQKWLVIALVVLEVIVLSMAGAILYARLNVVVDESLYRIHFTTQTSMFSVLLKESLLILAGMVAANLLALFVADRIWAHHVSAILTALRDMLARTRDLDLQADIAVPVRHRVLARALAWRSAERARHLALRESLEAIEAATSNTEFRAGLLALRAHLPEPDRRNSGPAQ